MVGLTQDRAYIAWFIQHKASWKDSLAPSPTLAVDLYWNRMAPEWWDTTAPYHSLPKCQADHVIRSFHGSPLWSSHTSALDIMSWVPWKLSLHSPMHSYIPVLSLGLGGRQDSHSRTASVPPSVYGAAWMIDHPLLICSLPFTPPDRLTQKASLARPAPSVGGTGEDEGINFWPADSGTACQSRPGNLVPFLCWLGASAQEWIKQGNSAWRTLPLGAAIPLSPESDSGWWSQHTPLHWHVPRTEQLPCSWKEGFVKKLELKRRTGRRREGSGRKAKAGLLIKGVWPASANTDTHRGLGESPVHFFWGVLSWLPTLCEHLLVPGTRLMQVRQVEMCNHSCYEKNTKSLSRHVEEPWVMSACLAVCLCVLGAILITWLISINGTILITPWGMLTCCYVSVLPLGDIDMVVSGFDKNKNINQSWKTQHLLTSVMSALLWYQCQDPIGTTLDMVLGRLLPSSLE